MRSYQQIAIVLLALLVSGCVYQRYVGVKISSTEPVNLTRLWVNGEEVMLYKVGE